MTKPKIDPKALTARALAPVFKLAATRKKVADELAAEISRMTGTHYVRQDVEPWLKEDPAKRVEPRFGMGLVLLRAFRRVRLKKLPKKGGDHA